MELDRTTGGSPRRAAAALLNSDICISAPTRGSIRIPAAFTGVFGIKRLTAVSRLSGFAVQHPGASRAVTAPSTDAALSSRDLGRGRARHDGWNTPAQNFRIESMMRARTAHRLEPAARYVKKPTGNRSRDRRKPRSVRRSRAIVEEAIQAYQALRDDHDDLGRRIRDHRQRIPKKNAPSWIPALRNGRGRRQRLAERLSGAVTARQDLAIAMERFHEKYDLLLTRKCDPALEAGRVTPATAATATTGSTGRLIPIRSI